MNYSVIKIENCFSDSESYEYTLPIQGTAMVSLLSDWEIRINQKLRRPVAIASKQGIVMKFILAGNRYRVSFPESRWQDEKQTFETYLENLI